MTETLGDVAPWTTSPDCTEAPLRVGIVSPRLEFAVTLAQQGLAMDMSATTAGQAPAVLAACSHVFVDLYIVDNAQALADLLQAGTAHVILVIPDDLVPAQQTEVSRIPGIHQCVREAELGPCVASLPGTAAPDPGTAAVPPVSVPAASGGTAVGGWRCVAVWSLEGGVGKTRITRALGLDCVRRGYRTLVMGLGSPDVLPLQASLDPEPNLSQWQRDPRPDVLARSVQADGDLDLLAGFLSPLALSRFATEALEGDTSLSRLAMQTAQLGYAAALLDVSAQELAAPALQAASTLVLVCSATPQGAVATVEAYRLARHEIGLAPSHCHIVINRYRTGQLPPGQFVGTVRSVLREVPDPVAVLPEDETTGDGRQSGPGTAWGGAEWQSALQDIGTCIWGAESPQDAEPHGVQQSRFGPLVIKRG